MKIDLFFFLYDNDLIRLHKPQFLSSLLLYSLRIVLEFCNVPLQLLLFLLQTFNLLD